MSHHCLLFSRLTIFVIFVYINPSKAQCMKKIFILSLLFTAAMAGAQSTFTYTGKPRYAIDVKRGGVFLGTITVELFPSIAPRHVRNFDSLVSVQFYDTTAFHRVIPGFVIQGGDPNSRHGSVNTWGAGQPGQPTVPAEFTATKHVRGILSAARSSNINSATSQFFICMAAVPSLNNQYSVYGRVVSGMNWADTIVNAPRNSNDLPNIKHEMFITAIGFNDTVPQKPLLNTPADGIIAVSPNTPLLLKWNAIKDAMLYKLEVAEDASFTNTITTIETANLSAYVSTGLSPDTKYYWRVRANNGGYPSDWSSTWTFDTSIDQVGISRHKANAESLSLFPNPGKGVFTFSNISAGSIVEIYDATGKLVCTSTTKESSLTIHLEGKEKGVYLYKVISETVTTGKLVIE